MHAKSKSRRSRWVLYSILPIVSAIVLAYGVVAWLRVPSPESLLVRASEREALEMRIQDLEQRRKDERKDDAGLTSKLPSKLGFADFIERLQDGAAAAGIDGLRVDTNSSKSAATPYEGMRGHAGTLEFETSWNSLVQFLSRVENGEPAMRVRSLVAEPTDTAIRVECVVDAWSLPASVLAKPDEAAALPAVPTPGGGGR